MSGSSQTKKQEDHKKKRTLSSNKGKEIASKTTKREKSFPLKEAGIIFKEPKILDVGNQESDEEEDYSNTAESSWDPTHLNTNHEMGESSNTNILNNLDEFGSFLEDEDADL
ncbi:hypothetical protein LINPERPRIM_LOCUS12964 [Linum perenne]